METIDTTYPSQFSRLCRKMSSRRPSKRPGLTYQASRVTQTTPGRRRWTRCESTNPQSTQRQAGADDEMNPTTTTGSASDMGGSGPEPSPQALYKQPIWERDAKQSPRHNRPEVRDDDEMNPTITTGSASYMGVSGPEPSPQALYGSRQATVSQGHSGP